MDTLTIYGAPKFGWRWTLKAANGRRIGASTEAYRDRNKCIANASRVLDLDLFVETDGCIVGRMSGPPVAVRIRGKR